MNAANTPHATEILVDTQTDEDGYVATGPVCMRPADENSTKVIECLPQAVIPVVFIPGIMGTNLIKTDEAGKPTRTVVWSVPHSIWGAITTAVTFSRKDAVRRRKELDPGATAVDADGDVDTNGSISEEMARKHGWGAVAEGYYQPVLAFMQDQLNAILYHGELEGWWKEHAGYAPQAYGDKLDSPKLTLANGSEPPFGDLDYAAHKYRFEVWAAGYNWLQSNLESAKHVKHYIDNTVLKAYPKHLNPDGKVIVVTHSMGGLVSRALTEVLRYDNVFGVVHGAQPATGAPALYHHVRAGYLGISQVVTGGNASEVTAVAANSRGALELLPFASYNHGQPWLFLETVDGRKRPLMASNPFSENGIYRIQKWYGLVPDGNKQWVHSKEGSSATAEPPANTLDLGDGTSSITAFSVRLDDVRAFQSTIDGKYYSGAGDKTYVFFGDDESESRLWGLFGTQCTTWGKIVWRADGPLTSTDPGQLDVRHDDGNGTVTLSNGTRLTIQPPDAPGDGTVPVVSGSAGTSGFKAAFSVGRLGSGARNEDKGFEHADAYNDARSRWATLYSILKMVHGAA